MERKRLSILNFKWKICNIVFYYGVEPKFLKHVLNVEQCLRACSRPSQASVARLIDLKKRELTRFKRIRTANHKLCFLCK
ncbi:hypothetical protein DUNSADRAFT_11599 [Dunaliella salina]|uniref:Encoded protein n=1 Tax=Dunaliella salina TaxID=3046 RepID=A0ABQ7GD25_DUNSA|nr:hypothetical protein DUNSADRAFT_11599 [Dunaliella salina]|eukprot:KAF5832499.1 hypothetical protein DUNSADRAFT_11599 [Dunaliella salina]